MWTIKVKTLIRHGSSNKCHIVCFAMVQLIYAGPTLNKPYHEITCKCLQISLCIAYSKNSDSYMYFYKPLRPCFFLFFVLQIFSQQVSVGGRNKNKNKVHSDHFPIELKSKETHNCVSFDFNSIGKWSE